VSYTPTDLNVGVKETTVLGAFHPDAIAVFNSCSDLKRVAYQLWDPTHHSEETASLRYLVGVDLILETGKNCTNVQVLCSYVI
jgi:hypothetical protein